MSTQDTTTSPAIDRRGIVPYLGLAFGLAWAWWAVVLYGLRLNTIWALLPGMFAPAIAAIVVRAWVTREGFAGAGLRPHLRRRWRYYLFALPAYALVAGWIVATRGLRRRPTAVTTPVRPQESARRSDATAFILNSGGGPGRECA